MKVPAAPAAVQQQGVDIGCHFILGGQIDRKKPRLFHIYPEDNFIEATQDNNFFQIGEHKYGKPIMDRVVKYHIPLKAASFGEVPEIDWEYEEKK
jgi:putative proteasome-type protease